MGATRRSLQNLNKESVSPPKLWIIITEPLCSAYSEPDRYHKRSLNFFVPHSTRLSREPQVTCNVHLNLDRVKTVLGHKIAEEKKRVNPNVCRRKAVSGSVKANQPVSLNTKLHRDTVKTKANSCSQNFTSEKPVAQTTLTVKASTIATPPTQKLVASHKTFILKNSSVQNSLLTFFVANTVSKAHRDEKRTGCIPKS